MDIVITADIQYFHEYIVFLLALSLSLSLSHTHTHTHTHAYIHTYIHTHTHTLFQYIYLSHAHVCYRRVFGKTRMNIHISINISIFLVCVYPSNCLPQFITDYLTKPGLMNWIVTRFSVNMN